MADSLIAPRAARRVWHFEIRPRAPYDLRLTAGHYVRFPIEAADRFEDGRYRRLLDDRGQLSLVGVRQAGPLEAPVLAVEVVYPEPPDGPPAPHGGPANGNGPLLRGRLRAMLGADDDLDPFYRAAARDPILAPLLEPLRGLRQARWPSGFETLVTSITAQQVNLSFAYAMRARLVRSFGRTLPGEGETFFAFPTAERLAAASPDALLALRYSRRKAEYIIDLARRLAEGTFDLASLEPLPDEAVVERLTTLRGVGRWTAEWYLIRALGRPDVFPADDSGVRRLIARAAGIDGPLAAPRASEIAERWRPHRSTALLYLVTAARLGLGPWGAPTPGLRPGAPPGDAGRPTGRVAGRRGRPRRRPGARPPAGAAP